MIANTELQPVEISALKRKIAILVAFLMLFFLVCILLPAGTFNFWQFYIYLAVLCGPMLLVIWYFFKKDPEFLVRRMRKKEREPQQKKIVVLTTVIFITGFIIPGLDRRFGWSSIPVWLVLTADFLVLVSYIFVFFVFRENSFASRIIEVDKRQTVITTGPYRLVRHPMYLGILFMYLSTPIALGSYWGLIPFAVVPFALVLRIRNEEKVLAEQLPGYLEYCGKVRFRMLPFLW